MATWVADVTPPQSSSTQRESNGVGASAEAGSAIGLGLSGLYVGKPQGNLYAQGNVAADLSTASDVEWTGGEDGGMGVAKLMVRKCLAELSAVVPGATASRGMLK